MSNIDALLEKIESDSKLEQKTIIDAAKKEAEEIVKKAREEAEEKASYIIKKTEEEAQSLLEKADSRAQLEARDGILKAKQDIFERVLKSVVDKLNNMSEEDYLEYVKQEIKKVDLSENASLKVLAKYRDYVKNNISEINLSEDTVDSGFAVEDGSILYNNDFENIIEDNRSYIETLVFNELFSTDDKK